MVDTYLIFPKKDDENCSSTIQTKFWWERQHEEEEKIQFVYERDFLNFIYFTMFNLNFYQ